MKKYSWHMLALGGVLVLASWGFKGHRAVATIAEKHLTPHTAEAARAYLDGQSLAEVSTWADEHRSSETAPWHFLNLPLGLDHAQFVAFVKASDANVYTAILKAEAQLKDPALSADQKKLALTYLIHLVGDAHQPMHISRKEDKGGNTIQLRFEDKGTNLHSLWDSKLIDHEGLSETDIVKNYDTATPAEVKQWQSDDPMEWIWESYQLSSGLYAEVKPGQAIDEAYYQKYIPVVCKRIDQAGIRLAGELNRLLGNASLPEVAAAAPVDLKDISNYVGKKVTVTGKIYSLKDIGSMVLANMGAAYPHQLLTLALKGEAKPLALEDKTVTVTGQVIDYKGKPEIIVTDPAQIKF
jgi:hypothetical protein